TNRDLTMTIKDRLRLDPLHPNQLRRHNAGPCVRAERLRVFVSRQALFEALRQQLPRKLDSDEDEPARSGLARRPGRAGIVAYELMHALEDDLALLPGQVEDALVAQQPCGVTGDQRRHELAESGRVKRPL